MAAVSQFDIDISPRIPADIDAFIPAVQLKLADKSGRLMEIGRRSRLLACQKVTQFL